MGLWNTLKNALGLERPLKPAASGPLALTDAARAALATLPTDQALHVATQPTHRGRTVVVDVGARQGPSPEGYDGLTIGDRDLERMRGLVLDHRDGGWHVNTHLELRAKETPNPNSRLYLCNRFLAEGRPLYFQPGPTLPDLPALLLAIPGARSVLLRDHTITFERQPDIPWDAIDDGVAHALQAYFLGTGHRLVARAIDHDGLLGEAQRVLEHTVLPGVHADGGDLQLLAIDDGVAKVRLQGACRSCPASAMTLQHGVARALTQAFPGQIHAVESVDS